MHEWSTILNANVDGFIVGEIFHSHPSAEWKSAMRGGKFFHVVYFTIGRAASVIRISIPTCDAGFRCANARGLRYFHFFLRRTCSEHACLCGDENDCE